MWPSLASFLPGSAPLPAGSSDSSRPLWHPIRRILGNLSPNAPGCPRHQGHPACKVDLHPVPSVGFSGNLNSPRSSYERLRDWIALFLDVQ